MTDITKDMIILLISTFYQSVKLFESKVRQFNLLLFFLFSLLNKEVSDSEDTHITIVFGHIKFREKEFANEFEIFKYIVILVDNTGHISDIFQS